MGIHRTITTAVAAATLLVTAAALAGPAAADSQTHRDPRGDVETTGPMGRSAPRAGVDVVGVENVYRGRTLTVSLSFANLQRQGYAAQWLIRTPDSDYFLSYDTVGSEPRVGFASTGPGGPQDVTCEGLDVQRRGDSLTGVVPRRCLEGADRVRVAGASIAFSQEEGPSQVDDSRRDGIDPSQMRPKYGPPLQRS